MTGSTAYQSGPLTFGYLRRLYFRLWLKGEKVRCNLCGNNFKRFLLLRPQLRPNAQCPVCGSTESTRTLWFYLSNEILGKKNKRNFLYFSPELSVLERIKAYPVSVTTAGKSYFNDIDNPVFTGKFKGGTFDVILFPQVLQFVDDDLAVLEELRRLLRTGGLALIMTVVNQQMDRTYEKPTSDEDRDRLFHFYEPGIVRVYGANFKRHLMKAGFRVEVVNYPEELGQQAQSYYQLGDGSREVIFKCKKA